MDDLIKALQLFRKYGNPRKPTHCEHDVFTVNIDPELVSDEDKRALRSLGFIPGDGDGGDEGCFQSYRFGSA